MKRIVINDHNLKDSDIDMKVVRVKGLMVNSKGKILLAHNNNTYQFPGGHVDEGETNDECIVREIKEETGIDVVVEEEPFLSIITYDYDYFGRGKKVLNTIYYYRFLTDEKPNFEKTHYDELELATDFDLFYININDLESFLQKSLSSKAMDPNIGREMLYVFDEYFKVYGS